MQRPFPEATRRQARRFVIALCTYWLLWGVVFTPAVYGMPTGGPLAAAMLSGLIASAVTVFVTLFAIWEPATGVPFWKVMIPMLPYSRRFQQSNRVMWSLVRPSWWAMVVGATGWPGVAVVAALAALIFGDLALFIHR